MGVITLIIQKPKAIPPSLMVSSTLFTWPRHAWFGRHWSHETNWLAKRGKVSRSQNQYLKLKLKLTMVGWHKLCKWKVNPTVRRKLMFKNESQEFAKNLAILQINHTRNHQNWWLGMALITMTIETTDKSLYKAKIWVVHKNLHSGIRHKSRNKSDSPTFSSIL